MTNTAADARGVGFIGLGTMGKPIAKHLIAAGHALAVCDLSRADIAEWEADGARFLGAPAEVSRAARIVFLSLPGPREVEAVVLGPGGLIEFVQAGDIVVDLSTNAYATVVRLAARLHEAGVAFVDAPVSGGVAGARKGSLAVLIGGEAAVLETLSPLLASFSAKVFHAGPAGMGTIAKLVNNQIFLTASTAVQEGFVLAAKAGLDANLLLEILKSSSAGPYMGLAPLFFGRAFDNVIFRLGLASKDLDVALQSAGDLGVGMPVTEAASGVFRAAIDQGLADKVFYATLQSLEAQAGVEVAKLAAKP